MLDSLSAVQEAIIRIDDPRQMLEAADNGASKVIADYKQLACKQGRARMFGKKTIGLDDPGMMVVSATR